MTTTTENTVQFTEAKREAMMVRIRLLFDKAEATDHEAERDAFMNKAQALLTQHSIDFADLKPSAVTADEVVTKRVWVTAPYTSSRSLLLSAIARANDIKMVNGRDSHWVPEGCLAAPEVNEHGQSKTKGRAVYLTGWSRDIDAAVMLFASLQIQMDREFLAIERPYYENAKAWRNSFMIGFASGVGKRLGQARRDAVNDAVAEARERGEDLLPALRSRTAQVGDVYEQTWKGRLRSGSRITSTGGAYGSGHRAGSRASFGTGGLRVGSSRALNA